VSFILQTHSTHIFVVNGGIETVLESRATRDFPATQVSLALLTGFAFMLLVERVSSGSHSGPSSEASYTLSIRPKDTPAASDVEFDADLDALEREESGASHATSSSASRSVNTASDGGGASASTRAFALTLGLCLHALTDGLALGVSALSDAPSAHQSEVSLVVFLALVIHKGRCSCTLCLANALRRSRIQTQPSANHFGFYDVASRSFITS
jgi:solute carrier family 39 (zinc transporter), member 9